jgi:hypothetical protein
VPQSADVTRTAVPAACECSAGAIERTTSRIEQSGIVRRGSRSRDPISRRRDDRQSKLGLSIGLGNPLMYGATGSTTANAACHVALTGWEWRRQDRCPMRSAARTGLEATPKRRDVERDIAAGSRSSVAAIVGERRAGLSVRINQCIDALRRRAEVDKVVRGDVRTSRAGESSGFQRNRT